jgi:hypothetical protein
MQPPAYHGIDASDESPRAHSEPGPNPLARGLNVTVSVPETIEFRMVDASALSDYEVWFFLASILWSAGIGFLVAFFQNARERSLLAMALIWFVLFACAAGMTVVKRRKLRAKSKDIKLIASEAVTTDKEDAPTPSAPGGTIRQRR